MNELSSASARMDSPALEDTILAMGSVLPLNPAGSSLGVGDSPVA